MEKAHVGGGKEFMLECSVCERREGGEGGREGGKDEGRRCKGPASKCGASGRLVCAGSHDSQTP